MSRPNEIRYTRQADGSYHAWNPYGKETARGDELAHVLADIGRQIQHGKIAHLPLRPARESFLSSPAMR